MENCGESAGWVRFVVRTFFFKLRALCHFDVIYGCVFHSINERAQLRQIEMNFIDNFLVVFRFVISYYNWIDKNNMAII